jgi:hypothetical protein
VVSSSTISDGYVSGQGKKERREEDCKTHGRLAFARELAALDRHVEGAVGMRDLTGLSISRTREADGLSISKHCSAAIKEEGWRDCTDPAVAKDPNFLLGGYICESMGDLAAVAAAFESRGGVREGRGRGGGRHLERVWRKEVCR